MKVLGIVPARKGSVRLPRKNLRELGGRPLVEWAIRAAAEAGSLDCVVVSSDDPVVLDVADRVLPGSSLPRPAELAAADSPAIDYVRHALSVVEEGGTAFDAVAIIQPTSPFTTAADIDCAVRHLAETGADSVVTVVRVAHDVHPAKLKRMEGDRLYPYIEDEAGRMAHQQLPQVFVRNCAVYVSQRSMVDRGELLGSDSRGIEMPRERSLDINDEFDFAVAEALLHLLNRAQP